MTNLWQSYYNYTCRKTNASYKCRCGGTGRRTGLKILRLNKPCRFDSGHLHQNHWNLTNFSGFYFYSKTFVSTDITAFCHFSLFNLFSKLFKNIRCFFTSAHNMHTRFAHKIIFETILKYIVTSFARKISCTHILKFCTHCTQKEGAYFRHPL